MLNYPAASKVYLRIVPCDMRRSFDGLSMMAEHPIGCNPFSGRVLVFCNRRNDLVKNLYSDRDGRAIRYNQQASHYTSFGSIGRNGNGSPLRTRGTGFFEGRHARL
ncbi:MAG: IS66 family insertion sequence element accessory protein TnpB [Terriglobia bacterium]